ncbi:DUF4436 family protein [bacterium]|nr:DUF4436 family protein [bacterium]
MTTTTQSPGNAVRWLLLAAFCLAMLVGGWSYQRWLSGMVAQKAATKDATLFEFDNEETDDVVRVIATISSVDPLKGDMTVRLETSAEGNLVSDDGTLKQDIHIYVNSVTGKADYPFKRGETMGPIEYTTSLDGSTFQYPNDRYQAYVEVIASNEKAEAVPLEVEGYSTAGGFVIRKGDVKDVFEHNVPEFDEGEARVVLNMERSAPVKLFARFILTLQWLLALSGLSVVLRVVIGGRKCELALFTWLTAMLFALPPMRNAMVGVPSIGIYVDFLGFLCAEGLVACSLAALVLTWHLRKAG